MAKTTMLTSDLSTEPIPEGTGATIRILFKDPRKQVAVLDVTDAEGDDLASKGRLSNKRGKKPGSTKTPVAA
jgi:hypothetical protein